MKTIIYLVRHCEEFKKINRDFSNDNLQVANEKGPLSVNGEMKARILSELDLFDNITKIYSSNYVRAISTAKYISTKLNLNINILDELGERKFGVEKYSELDKDFGIKQYNDFSYKMKNGECLKEVQKRMKKIIDKIVVDNVGKEVLVISHSTAMLSYFSYYGTLDGNQIKLTYKENIIAEGKWDSPAIYKVTFSDNEVINIENVNETRLNLLNT